MSKDRPSPEEQSEYEGFLRAALGKKKPQGKQKQAPPKGPNRGDAGKQFNETMNSKC